MGNIRSRLEFTESQEGEEETADMCKALAEIEKDAIRKGHKQGVKEGHKEGQKQGLQLARQLLKDGRQEELARSAEDAAFMKKMLREYKML